MIPNDSGKGILKSAYSQGEIGPKMSSGISRIAYCAGRDDYITLDRARTPLFDRQTENRVA